MLAALGGRSARIALMTAIGATNREGDYNRQAEAHDWKRRGERLVPDGYRAMYDREMIKVMIEF